MVAAFQRVELLITGGRGAGVKSDCDAAEEASARFFAIAVQIRNRTHFFRNALASPTTPPPPFKLARGRMQSE